MVMLCITLRYHTGRYSLRAFPSIGVVEPLAETFEGGRKEEGGDVVDEWVGWVLLMLYAFIVDSYLYLKLNPCA